MMAHPLELDLSNLTISNSTEDTSAGTTLTEFHLFTELPLELQQNIWGLYLPGPQNVIIKPTLIKTQCTDPPDVVDEPFGNISMGLGNTAIPPLSEPTAEDQKATTITRVRLYSSEGATKPSPLLSVCRTSREYTLSIYTACIETPGFDRKIRLRPKKDILVLYEYGGGLSRKYIERCEMSPFSDISVVALHVPLKEGNARSQSIEDILKIFPKLEKLLVFPMSGDITYLEIYTGQGYECFIRPIIAGDHIRSNEALSRWEWSSYEPSVNIANRDEESMQGAIQKVQLLHAAKGNEQGEPAENRLIKVELVCACLGASHYIGLD